MTTVVSELIKIVKIVNKQFENRMRFLESNGYDKKEKLIHDIFSKSRVFDTELFALDIDVAKCLLSYLLKCSFCGNTYKGYIPSISRNAKKKIISYKKILYV